MTLGGLEPSDADRRHGAHRVEAHRCVTVRAHLLNPTSSD